MPSRQGRPEIARAVPTTPADPAKPGYAVHSRCWHGRAELERQPARLHRDGVIRRPWPVGTMLSTHRLVAFGIRGASVLAGARIIEVIGSEYGPSGSTGGGALAARLGPSEPNSVD